MKFASIFSLIFFLVTGTLSDPCPDYFDFRSCPREMDSPSETNCCRINNNDSCCIPSYEVWLVVVVSVCIVSFSTFVGIVCCCCMTGCYFYEQRKRKDYIWVRSDPYGKNLSYQNM